MLNFAVRSGTGLEIWNVDNKEGTSARQFQPHKNFIKEETRTCKAITFSDKFFAYCNGTEVKVLNSSDFSLKVALPRSRAHVLKFSPKGTYLIVYEIFISTKENPDAPNLFVYDLFGNCVTSLTQKRHSEFDPANFFAIDESFFAIMLNGDVHFYEKSADSFSKTQQKLTGKVGGFSISSGQSPHVALYIRGAKAAPSLCRLFKYPNLDSSPVASKSFSQADKVEMIWNKRGTGCLIMTSTDVDSTGASYYGKQALHFLATSGDSYSVPLSADGPIHSVAWSPKSNQFTVVYGNMPAKATLFNMKCDAVFDFGTGIRNSIYFNDFGNLVLFGGFGNLRGNIEVWDLQKKKQVSTSLACDTTLLEWSPCGELYLTATTAPRLRQGNGFKIWHYTGSLLYELLWPEKQELLELQWQKYPEGAFKETAINYVKVEGIQSIQPQASAKKYVPPNIRNFGADDSSSSPSVAPPAQGPIPGLPPGYTSSKKTPTQRGSNINNFNNRNNRKKPTTNSTAAKSDTNQTSEKLVMTSASQQQPQQQPNANEEIRKKATAMRKKLKDIKILKEKLEKGEKLDKNQMNKIASEPEITREIAALKIS